MITASQLKTLTTMCPTELANDLKLAGHKNIRLTKAKFLGMTNGHQFCYSVVDGDGGVGKVFVDYDPTVGRVFATMA